MKRIVSLVLSIVMLASCLSIGMFTSMAANEPTPIYYENFANKTVADIESTLVRNHAPNDLKLAMTEANVPYVNGASQVMQFQTLNKNNESTTVFKLYDLPETVTDFAVYVRFSFSSDFISTWKSWGSTTRFGLAYNIDGEIVDGEHCGTAELRKSTSKTFRQNDNTYKNATSISQSVPGVTVNSTTEPAADTFYEMGLVVSGGKMYSYLNGKLVPLGKDNTTSIPYTKTGSGLGFFAAYTNCYVDDFVVYDSAYVPAGYDSLTGAGSTIDAALAATVPALPANLTPDKIPAPAYYENVATTTAADFLTKIVRCHDAEQLKLDVVPKAVNGTDYTNTLFVNPRMKNNEGTTVMNLYDLANGVDNFSVFVRFAFTDELKNSGSYSYTSRFALALNIDGEIADGESVHAVELRQWATYDKDGTKNTGKGIRHLTNTYANGKTTASSAIGQGLTTPDWELNKFYELAAVVSNGQIYVFVNGKLMPLGTDGATSIPFTKTASGIGFFATLCGLYIDDFRVYETAYVPAGYDAIDGAANTVEAAFAAALPALPATCVADVQESPVVEPEEPEVPLGPAPEAGTILYEQNFDNVTTETLGAIQIKDSAQDFVWGVENGTLMMSAPTSSSSHGMLQLYELPKNVTSFTIVMDVRFGSVADMSEKNLIGPAYSIKDDQNWSNLSLRANGTYNFTRQTDNNWVSNKTYPDGGSSRNSKYYSVEGDKWYTLCMVVTTEGRIRSYINGILQPDNVPLIQDGYGIGAYIRNGTSYVDNMVVYAGQYVPAGYDDITGEGSYEDDLYIEEETEEDTTVAGGENETTGEEVTTKVEDTTTKKPEETTASNKTDDKKGGCGAVVGTASICLIAILAGGALTLRKKEN